MNNNNKISLITFVNEIDKNESVCEIVTKSGCHFPVMINKVQSEGSSIYRRASDIFVECRLLASDMSFLTKTPKKVATFRPEIKKVIFNDPVTVVIWSDDQKTIVRAQNGEPFDPEKGLALAIAKRALGNTGSYYDTFKKWIPSKEEEADS